MNGFHGHDRYSFIRSGAQCWLWIAYLTLDVVLAVVAMTLARSAIDGGVSRQQIAIVVVALLVDVAVLVFAVLMRGGRNWARIVLAVVGGLRVLILLFILIAGAGGPMVAVLFLLVAAAVTTMFVPAANAWFVPRQRAS
jgi:hypothetical protein